MSMAWDHKYMHARRDMYTQTHFSQNCQINLYNTKKTVQFCSLSQVLRNLKQRELFSIHPRELSSIHPRELSSIHPRGSVTAEMAGFPGAVVPPLHTLWWLRWRASLERVCPQFTPHAEKYSLPLPKPPALYSGLSWDSEQITYIFKTKKINSRIKE